MSEHLSDAWLDELARVSSFHNYGPAFHELISAYRELRDRDRAGGWVRVEDGLPAWDQIVETRGVNRARLSCGNWIAVDADCDTRISVNEWRPLPQPAAAPKDEGGAP